MMRTTPQDNAQPADAVLQRVLVVEDIADTRETLRDVLALSLGLTVDTAADGEQALAQIALERYSLVVTDLRMPKVSGMKLIEEIRAKKMPISVIVTTGHGGVPEAVRAMRLGCVDFLTKPADPDLLCALVQKALAERALHDEVAALRQQLQGQHSFQNVISRSPRMHDVFELIGNIATTTSTVLIGGETGTGKEQVARAIHQASAATRPGPFIPINCAALPETLLESELFGHEKGSFTGAAAMRRGRFEQADHGTLFLDEVGDVPAPMQVKLLRVLQERSFERVGGTETLNIDVRVIAATNRPLEKMVKDGTFREDLFYRLNVIRIDLPPLRDRREDIPVLVGHFVQKYARNDQQPPQVSPEAMQVLIEHPWPGNVRQLENAVERACVTAREGTIQPTNLPADVVTPAGGAKTLLQVDLARALPAQLAELTANFEERYLRRALKKTRGHVGKCARVSGLSRRSITDKIAHYKIDKSEFKRDN